jgi:glyoxylase-like metal-dependent hydrolase (beta-lactamase superfamily II)|tara:strand:+ start:5692 stop:6744 length:1053 start_codon:yes stop_codon:yes gene_type:complete
MRQEQQPASTDVTEVAPGLYRFQLPISMPGLGHVNCYALEDADGFTVVDPGLPSIESWEALGNRLDQVGARYEHVHTAVVTHSHPDHFGGVHRLRDDHGTRVLTHVDFRSVWMDAEIDDLGDEELDLADDEHMENLRSRMSRPTPWGETREPPPAAELRRWSEMDITGGSRSWQVPEPSVTVDDGEEITLGGRTWLAVHTPGHTHDHLCLFDPAGGLLLSGDHVLPTITPHINGIGPMDDPLATFFRSLERMKELSGLTNVLPAHGHPFTDVAGRVDAILSHHEERLETIREAGDDMGEGTVESFMQRLFKERSWGDMAASETYAHLEHLRILGMATRDEVAGQAVYRTN